MDRYDLNPYIAMGISGLTYSGLESMEVDTTLGITASDVKGVDGVEDVKTIKKVPVESASMDNERIKSITNDVLESPRTGSALKVDSIKPTYAVDPISKKSYIMQEFPARAQAHGFNDLVDNYAGSATKTSLGNATLYQLEGSLNGAAGRFKWIIQDGKVTHRMFIQGGTMNGVAIKP
ncbi:MAG TPA: hypothetical protein VK071_11665 [Tissierellales bacterium]|nr:hypothetical protein [Tissierellales bacterium]